MRTAVGFLFITGFMVLFSFLLLGLFQEESKALSFPEVLKEETALNSISIPKNSYIYDKDNELITELTGGINRHYIDYKDIPQNVKQAFLSTEDTHFFEHSGVDLAAVARALAVNIHAGGIEEGASTITQQVVRNLYLSHEQSYNRKLSEVLYAVQLEKEHSKEKILEYYINTIYFQNGIYGFETAARYYFGKSSKKLSLAEIAFLAAVPANPEHYDPLTKKENTKLRQEWILKKMEENNVISKKQRKRAVQKAIILSVTKNNNPYPDYTFYVEHELTQLIASKEGYQSRINQALGKKKSRLQEKLQERVNEVLQSGIHIQTSLHPELQQTVVSAVKHNLQGTDAEGSAVVINHADHNIAALSGGKNYQNRNFNRAFQAYRQPGSAIKPLLVYGPYINQTGAAVTQTVNAGRYCRGDYCPSNAGGGYYGNVTLETALAQSYNTAALRLFEKTGVEKSFSYLENMGFSRLQPEDHRYAAALGGLTRGVTPLELTQAYTVFSNQGTFIPSRAIQKVTDGSGRVLYEWNQTEQQIWKESTNEKLRQMMRKVVTEGTGRGLHVKSGEWRGKTGTTNHYHDLWFTGYNEQFTAGVWIGKDTPSSLQSLDSSVHLRLFSQAVQNLSEK